jgi:hypothetical protein
MVGLYKRPDADPQAADLHVTKSQIVDLISCRTVKLSNIQENVELIGLFFFSDPRVLRGLLRLG